MNNLQIKEEKVKPDTNGESLTSNYRLGTDSTSASALPSPAVSSPSLHHVAKDGTGMESPKLGFIPKGGICHFSRFFLPLTP
jgi:hypothetical protein